MDDRYKRLNRLTGEPFLAGYQDESGRIFLRYLRNKVMMGIILKSGKKTLTVLSTKLMN